MHARSNIFTIEKIIVRVEDALRRLFWEAMLNFCTESS